MSIDLTFRDESESKFMGGERLNESLIYCYKHCMGKHLVVGNPCGKGLSTMLNASKKLLKLE